MKSFDKLSVNQQESAVNNAATDLLNALIEGGLRFNDKLNDDDLQARIDAACQRANDMQTPWFAHEYIMDTCRDEIMGMAQCDAEDALYYSSGESVRQEPKVA